jgi:hypothetical protein
MQHLASHVIGDIDDPKDQKNMKKKGNITPRPHKDEMGEAKPSTAAVPPLDICGRLRILCGLAARCRCPRRFFERAWENYAPQST